MKIGDFARLCGTRISILQHYDKVGVLRPMYTDRFTNYRYYPQTGETTSLVMRKVDSRRYSAKEIARKDDINKPFLTDKRVIGKWKSCGYLDASFGKDRIFHPARLQMFEPFLFFKEILFSEGGHCSSLYGEKWIQGDDMQVWTKGYVLRKWDSAACAYEIRRAEGREYLIMEWKSGDYIWGSYETDYYVFLREGEGENTSVS